MANFNRSSKAGKVKSKAGKDFQLLRSHMADRWGPVRLGNSIQRVRTVFKYGYEVGLIVNPVRYGPSFKKPPARVIRNNRKNKMLTAGECRSLIDAAPAPVKAMVLLGLNCGFGNHDCATLPETAIDLKAGWVDYRRTKTGIVRRYPLWPETISALEETAAIRPIPKTEDAKGLVFVTVRGRPWLSGGIANPVTVAGGRLMKEVGVHREGLGFYTLRHVFRTVVDGAGDQPAANAIMGHADGSMAATYREPIEDSRLQAVTNHVRAWLFGSAK